LGYDGQPSLLRQRCTAGLPAVAAEQRRLVPVEGFTLSAEAFENQLYFS
jgi:hypothetical protein